MLYTPEQLEIQKAAGGFVAKYIIPYAAEADRAGEFPSHLLEAAKESKVFAMAIPKKYGGLEYDSLTQALVCEEWSYGCAGMGMALYHAAQLVDDGEPFEVESAMLKSFLARLGSKLLVDSCQVEGGMGFVENMPLPRLFRDIAGTTLVDTPSDTPERAIAMSIA
jgi:alkylation response protein AidB-like acyl-CoA dehydrogenase